MPLEMRVRQVRVDEVGEPFGLVHFVLDVRFARKRKVTLCGVATDGMRSQSTPFRGSMDVACDVCAERLEL